MERVSVPRDLIMMQNLHEEVDDEGEPRHGNAPRF